MSYENLYKEAKFRDAVNAAKKVIKSSPVGAGFDAMAGNIPGAVAGMGANSLEGAAIGATLGAGYTGAQALYQKVKSGEITKEEIKEQLKSNTVKGAGVGAGVGAAMSVPGITGQFKKEASEYNTGGYEDMYYNLDKTAAPTKQQVARTLGGAALGAATGAGAYHGYGRAKDRKMTRKEYLQAAAGGALTGGVAANVPVGRRTTSGVPAVIQKVAYEEAMNDYMLAKEAAYNNYYMQKLAEDKKKKKKAKKQPAKLDRDLTPSRAGLRGAGHTLAGGLAGGAVGGLAGDALGYGIGRLSKSPEGVGMGRALGSAVGATAGGMAGRAAGARLAHRKTFGEDGYGTVGALTGPAVVGIGQGVKQRRYLDNDMQKSAEEIYADVYYDTLEKIAAEEEAIINDAIATQEMAEAGVPAHIEDVAYNELYDDEDYMDESAPIDEYMKEDLHPGEGNVPTPEEVEEEMEAVANYFDGLQGLRKEAAYYYGY